MTWSKLRCIALDRGGLLTLVTLVLYVWLAPQRVVDGDNSEFATLSVTGGAAHPSGYPLYVLWLRLMSWLPGASPAHAAGIATALLGACTVLVLHAASRAWGARPLAATIAVAIFATGPVVLRVVTEAEAFALNNLVVATVLWLAARGGPARGWQRALLLGLVAGLGLANHMTCALVAPIGILGLVRATRETRRGAIVALPLALSGLTVGLLPYVYLLVAPDTPLSWGVVRDLERLSAMILREDYGGPTAFRATATEASPWSNVILLGRTLGRAWLWVPLVAGLAALALRVTRVSRSASESTEPRTGWAMLALAFVIAGPLLVLRFNVPAEGLGLYVNQRFHLLPALLLVIPVAHALDHLPIRNTHLVTVFVASIGVPSLAALSIGYVGRIHSPAVETGAKNLLRSLPPDSVVIHGQDELHAVTGYVQWALGERQDVVFVTWPLMKLPWYRERVARRGITSGRGGGSPEVRLVTSLLAQGRPVFVDRLQRKVIEALPTHPYGVLIRVVPPGVSMPSVLDVFAMNEQLYSAFELAYDIPGPDDEFATEVHNRYRDIWLMISKALDAQGYKTQAARARGHADKLAPRGN